MELSLKKYKNLSKMGNLKRMNFEDFPKHVNFDWGLGTHNFEKYILIMSNIPTSLVIQNNILTHLIP